MASRQCPHPDVRFFLFTQQHPDIPEEIFVGAEPLVSNLTLSSFDPNLPSKVIIHGFNSDMLLHGLIEIKNQYLFRDKYNIFTIDWGAISQGPCYPAAVWNARFAGRCGALLIDRLRETGNSDIHLIGFSLGAHVSGFIANNVRPYRIPRITGLDPALPAFTTPNLDDKLDKTDALFVDVIHTNAFFQGKVEECGHVDFYMNGGSIQPGCWADERSLACNHHRAAFYYAESINSPAGFWGWYCPSYIMYLLGRCPPKEPQIPMGEDVVIKPLGMHLVITDSVSPFAVGRFEGPTIDILIRHADRGRTEDFQRFKGTVSEDCRHADHQLHPDLGDLNWDGLDFSPLLEDRPAQLPFPEHPPPPPPPGHEIQPALPPHLLEFPPIHQELPLELRPGFAKEPSPPPPPFPPRPQIPPFDDLLDELDDYLLVR